MEWLLAAFGLAYLILAAVNLRAAALLTLALLPTYLVRFEIFNLPTTLLEAQIIILFIVWLIFFLSSLRSRKSDHGNLIQNLEFRIHNFPSLMRWGVIFIFLSGLISIFVGENIWAGAGLFRAFIFEPLMFIFILFYTLVIPLKNGIQIDTKTQNSEFRIHNSKLLSAILWPLGISAAVLSVFAGYQYLTGHFIDNAVWAAGATRRATSFFTYPNALALFVAPISASFFVFAYLERKNTLAKLGVAVLGLLGVLVAVSKGAILGLVLGLALTLFFTVKNKKKYYYLAIGFVLAILLFIPNSKFQIPNSIMGDSGLIRFSLWQETFQFLNTNWLWGTGWNGLAPALAPLHRNAAVEIYSYPHNLFLNFWATLGLLGFLGVIFVLVATFKKIVASTQNSELRTQNWIIMAGLLAMIIHGLVDVPFFKNDLAILWWIFILAPFHFSQLTTHNS